MGKPGAGEWVWVQDSHSHEKVENAFEYIPVITPARAVDATHRHTYSYPYGFDGPSGAFVSHGGYVGHGYHIHDPFHRCLSTNHAHAVQSNYPFHRWNCNEYSYIGSPNEAASGNKVSNVEPVAKSNDVKTTDKVPWEMHKQEVGRGLPGPHNGSRLHPWLGRTEEQVQHDNKVIAEKSGANKPHEFEPRNPASGQLFWVVKKNGDRTLHNKRTIDEAMHPGRWEINPHDRSLYFIQA